MSKASSTTAASRFASEWWRPSTATSKPSCAADAGTRTSATCSSRLSAWPLPKLNSSLSGEPHEMALRSNSCSEPYFPEPYIITSMWKQLNIRALPLGIAFILASPFPQIFAAQSDDEQTIHRLEDQIANAMGKNDADALSKLWASDYVFVNPAGQRLTAAERLQMLRTGERKEATYARDQES